MGNPLGAYLTAKWQMLSLGRDRNCPWIMDPVPQANVSQRNLVIPALDGTGILLHLGPQDQSFGHCHWPSRPSRPGSTTSWPKHPRHRFNWHLAEWNPTGLGMFSARKVYGYLQNLMELIEPPNHHKPSIVRLFCGMW